MVGNSKNAYKLQEELKRCKNLRKKTNCWKIKGNIEGIFKKKKKRRAKIFNEEKLKFVVVLL